MMQRTKDWILRQVPRFLICAPVFGLCAAAMYRASAQETIYDMEFTSSRGFRGSLACDTNLDDCFKAASQHVCKPGETFQITGLEYRKDGTPSVKWRCVIFVDPPPN